MSHIGEIGPFDKNSDLQSYLERFDYFIEANGVDNSKKKSTFLSVIGENTFSLIKDLAQPKKVADLTFDEIVDLLKSHLIPQASIIVYRYQFDKMVRGTQEPIGIYINKLRNMSEKCKFGTNLNERLRDKLVSSLNDDKIIGRLLSEGDTLTFTRACEISLQLEQNRKDTENLLSGKEIYKMQITDRNANRFSVNSRNSQSCYRCNGKNHKPENCFFRNKVCNGCHKKGHKEAACRFKAYQNEGRQGKFRKPQQRTVKQVCDIPVPEVHVNESDNEYQIMTVKNRQSSLKPITVELGLNGVLTKMEVDTGAAVSVITKETWHRIKKHLRINQQDVKLIDYNGKPIFTIGRVKVPVQHNDQNITLPAVVVNDGTCNLIGRDWLQHLKLDWKKSSR